MKIKYTTRPYPVNSVGWWLEKIKDPDIRAAALHNAKKENIKEKSVGIWQALYGGFDWAKTPEGSNYWANLAEEYQQKEGI